MPELESTFKRLEQDLGGVLGVKAIPLDPPGEAVAYRAGETFRAASTIKVFVLQALLERVQRGAARLDQERVLQAEDQVTGSGVLKSLSPGRSYTLLDLATLMIIVSDNTATNLLIDVLGTDSINEVCAARGWTGTRLAGKLQIRGSTSNSVTTPEDLADAFARLWRGELLDEEHTAIAQQIYRRQHYTDNLGYDLGFDAYSTETGEAELVIASKSGSIRGVRNDAGVIAAPQARYALAVMTKDCADPRFYPDNLGSRTIRKVSKALFDHFVPPTHEEDA